ncbi:ABC-2 family transporter protein [Acetitomaculum ruminis DSM 5522]|uniref:ABC-2 family transporter protein n=1 Tax=Acetitomaculum ruminis DSM 5522 TaxID=1120918 RepID=A0A1I0Z8Y9_9FIRM|nr:ABC-2 transporter permease [Acetitomaculum ruminis]SFB21596.1 ABC-2 family transporter protein [Acetitomaculum ruminis DSM 5522]
MNTLNYIKIDFLKNKRQIILIPMFAIFAVLLSKNSNISGASYAMFAGTIVGINAFTSEKIKEIGFISMLPGKNINKVAGRFLYGMINMVILEVLFLALYCIISDFSNTVLDKEKIFLIVLSTMAGIVLISIEYTIFYILGKFKSQSLFTFIMMLPGMLLFFLSVFFLEDEKFLNFLFTRSIEEIYLLVTVAFIIIVSLCFTISVIVVNKKDERND